MGIMLPLPAGDDNGSSLLLTEMPVNELFVKNEAGTLQGTGVTVAQLKQMAGNVQTSLVGEDGKIMEQYLPEPPAIAAIGLSGRYEDLSGAPVLARVAESGSWNDLADRPSLFSGSWEALTDKPLMFSGSWADLRDKPAFAAVASSGQYSDLAGLPVLFSGRWADVTGKPVFAAVATSGAYDDLTNKPALFDGSWDALRNKPVLFSGAWSDLSGRPTIPAAQQASDWNATTGVTQILNKPALFSGDYNDLRNLPTLAQGQVQSDWNATAGPALILNKPAIPAAQQPADWNAVDGPTAVLNKPVLFSGKWMDITGKPSFAAVASSGAYNDLTGKPVLFDGAWSSLTGKPDIPAAQVQPDWNATSGMAAIKNKPSLFDGTWQSLLNKPTFATVATTGRFADLLGAPVMPKAVETLQGTPSTTANTGTGLVVGAVDFVFANTYTNVPHVNPVLYSGVAGLMMTVTNLTAKGCRVTCLQRSAVTLLGAEVLLAATTGLGGVSVGLLVVSRD